MITRVRAEAIGDTEEIVKNDLAAVLFDLCADYGNSWETEEPGLQVVTASKGFWGRLTVRRKVDAT